MNYLGSKSFSCIDVSDYEGADIICDLSDPIPQELNSRFDFIYDGSCLDNIFNPAMALTNISRLLRPGGRVILVNHATSFNGPYTVFSPGWFFDYFVANKYEDCQVFLGIFSNIDELMYGPMQVYFSNWFLNQHGILPEITYDVGNVRSAAHILLFVVAEKGEDSTSDVRPIQKQYRDTAYDETTFKANALHVMNSKRRYFSLQNDLSTNNEPFGFIPLVRLGEGIPR
jgi:SAM-dependent methyltransferase